QHAWLLHHSGPAGRRAPADDLPAHPGPDRRFRQLGRRGRTVAGAAGGHRRDGGPAARHRGPEGDRAVNADGMTPWRLMRATLVVMVAVFLLAPLAVVVIISFSSAPFLQFPPPGFSLRWYDLLFSTPAWTHSLWVSVQLFVPSSILATILGT